MIRFHDPADAAGPDTIGSGRRRARPAPAALGAFGFGAALAVVGGWRWSAFESARLAHHDALSARTQGIALAVAVGLIAALVAVIVHHRATRLAATARAVEVETRKLRHQSQHDVLTGLPNRQLVRTRAHEILLRSRADRRPMMACLIDLDNFKEVNDSYGHNVGDQLLSAVAARLSAELAGAGTMGRLGGDEFIVLAEGRAMLNGPNGFARRILAVLDEPFVLPNLGGVALPVSASVGVAMGPRNDVEDLFRDADIALYRAKEAGRHGFVVFEPHMFHAVVEHQALLRDLRGALGRDEFAVVYQPVIDLQSGLIAGAEALLRWHHPTRGTVGPLEFVPALEESGLILDVGRFVVREAVRQATEWRTKGHKLQLAVNVSARQLTQESFVDDVRGAIHEHGFPPDQLTLEITETVLIADNELPALRLAELKQLGVSLAVDDFGTGSASISYLRRFPFDILKIDQSYMESIGATQSSTLLDAMLGLGQAVGMILIAEGIISQEQLRHLAAQGCGFGQGYGFARPTTPTEFDAFLARGWRPALFSTDRGHLVALNSVQRGA